MSEPRRRSRQPRTTPAIARSRSRRSHPRRVARDRAARHRHTPCITQPSPASPSPDPDAVVFRLLCPSDRVGALLGARRRRPPTPPRRDRREHPPPRPRRRPRPCRGPVRRRGRRPAQPRTGGALPRVRPPRGRPALRPVPPPRAPTPPGVSSGPRRHRRRQDTRDHRRARSPPPLDASVGVVEIEGSPALACSAAIRAVSSRLRLAVGAAVEGYGRPVEGYGQPFASDRGAFPPPLSLARRPAPRGGDGRRRGAPPPFPLRASEKS